MDHDNDKTEPTRDGHGQYARNPETAHRDAEAARLRSRGHTYRQIGAELGIHPASAHEAVKRAMAEVLIEPATDAIAFELDRLDRLYRAALEVLERRHVTVSNGKVIDLGGEPLLDDAPVLNAIDRLLRVSESRRRLLGLDQPAKTNISGGVTYEILGMQTPEA